MMRGSQLLAFLVLATRSLRFRLGQNRAIRNQADKSGEPANRQTVDKHIDALAIDAAAADFEPAPQLLADALRRVGGVRAGFRRIGHASAIASLQVREQMIRGRLFEPVIKPGLVVVPQIEPIERVRQKRAGGGVGGRNSDGYPCRRFAERAACGFS